MIKVKKGMLGAVCNVFTGEPCPVEELGELAELECAFTLHGGNTQPVFEYNGSLEEILLEHSRKTGFDKVYFVSVYGIIGKCNNTLVIEPIGLNPYRFRMRNDAIKQIV